MSPRNNQIRNRKRRANVHLRSPTVESETESVASHDRIGHHDQSSAASINDCGISWNGGSSNRADVSAAEEAGYRSMQPDFAAAEAECRASHLRQACPEEQQYYAAVQPPTPAPVPTPYYIAPQTQPHTIVIQQPQEIEFRHAQQMPMVQQQQPLNYLQSAVLPLPQQPLVLGDGLFPSPKHFRYAGGMRGDFSSEWFPSHLPGGAPLGGLRGRYASRPHNTGNQTQASSATRPSYPTFMRGNPVSDAGLDSPELFEAFGETFNTIKDLEADLRKLGKKVNRIMQLRYRE